MPWSAGGVQRLADQHVAHRLLEAGRHVTHVDGDAVALLGLDPAGDRGLEAGEREVEAVALEVAAAGEAAREVDGHLAVARSPVDVGAAREGQPEEPGDLVEGLAGGVVDGGAEGLHPGVVAGHVGDPEQAGVPTADQQRQAGLRQGAVLELVDRDVRGQVVDAVDRLPETEGQCLGGGDPDQQRADQARAAGDRDRVDVVGPDAGGLAGPLDGRHHGLEVGTAGHLGHDPSEPRVLLDAAGDRVGEQGVAADDADTGLVAGGLDAEDQGLVGHESSFSRTTAVVPSP